MAKFKIGDRVEAVADSPGNHLTKGQKGTVKRVDISEYHSTLVSVDWDTKPHPLGPIFEERLTLAGPETVSYPAEFKPLLDAAIAVASARREHMAAKEGSEAARRALEEWVQRRDQQDQERFQSAQRLSAAELAFGEAAREAAKL